MSAIRVASLGEYAVGFGGRAGGDGDILAAAFPEHAVDDPGAGFGVAEGGGNAEDFEFGAAQGESDGEGVVDVVADVGIDDDFFVRRRGLRGAGRGNDGKGEDQAETNSDLFRAEDGSYPFLASAWLKHGLPSRTLTRTGLGPAGPGSALFLPSQGIEHSFSIVLRVTTLLLL
jgi:hypothetical protein